MSQQPSWYDNQPYGIGDSVQIIDAAALQEAGSNAGRVVGYYASGPRPGEAFIRILVMPDGPTPAIVALPPDSLSDEQDSPETGLARTILVEMEQNLPRERFLRVLEWLRSDVRPTYAEVRYRPQTDSPRHHHAPRFCATRARRARATASIR